MRFADYLRTRGSWVQILLGAPNYINGLVISRLGRFSCRGDFNGDLSAVLGNQRCERGLCRSAPSALRVSFASKSNHAVLALRAYNLKGEP